MKLIGLAGYAKVGKDTAADQMPDFARFYIADHIRAVVMPTLEGSGCDITNPVHKETARPLLVEMGRTVRRFKPDYWINLTMKEIERHGRVDSLVVDVRYRDEVDAIVAAGGTVIRIDRPGLGPRNEEEALTFPEIERAYPDMLRVSNDSTPEELGRRIARLIEGL